MVGYDEARPEYLPDAARAHRGLGTVAAASYTGRLPLMAGSSIDNVMVDGAELAIHYTPVDTDYFRAIGIPVVAGRAFVQADDRGAPNVAIVNETLARRIAPDGRVIGRTFRFRNTITTTIVGVARDAKYATLLETTPPFAYFPLAQAGSVPYAARETTGDRSDFRRSPPYGDVDRPNLPPPASSRCAGLVYRALPQRVFVVSRSRSAVRLSRRRLSA